ncbi:MAG: ferrous iron transport protein A [Acidobacteria bacterium]|nr:ferrous iron transport protein A [Acidobacteriota bacterium]
MADSQRFVGTETEKGRNQVTTLLSELAIGATAKVVNVSGEGMIAKRLMEMGVVPGVTVRVVKAAPFGDPIQIRVRGYSLAIRRNEAETIEVTE